MARKPNPLHFGEIRQAQRRPGCNTPLAAWCRTTGVSAYSLAKQLRADPKAVSSWAEGKNLPSLPYAILLEITTKGGVPVLSWSGTDLFKTWMNNCRFDWDQWLQRLYGGRKRRQQRGKEG